MSNKFKQTSYYPNFGPVASIQKITITSTAASLSIQMVDDIELFRIVGTTNFYYKTGQSSTVTAASSAGGASVFCPSATPEYFNTKNHRWVSFIADASTGAFVNLAQMTQ